VTHKCVGLAHSYNSENAHAILHDAGNMCLILSYNVAKICLTTLHSDRK